MSKSFCCELRKQFSTLKVKCDNQSLATYPDLVYTVNGANIVLYPSDYIDTDQSLFDIWKTLVKTTTTLFRTLQKINFVGLKNE
ncbi:hypothetical protein M3Y98_00886200 [Aphelenchoides besseyi]|nr:hypothetical protein M3Y98_00886200 [Aphelenchoides besseyi]KAI6192946.1 hypothetical protein M3Y96_00966300 [Aphelenchoides besseyi]